MQKNVRLLMVLAFALAGATGASLNAFGQSISPLSADLTPDGGTGTIDVAAPAGTSWSAVSNEPWIQIVNPSSGSGTGSGKVEYKVLPDPNSDLNHFIRVGTVAVGSQTFTVSQYRPGQTTYDAWAAALPVTVRGPGEDAAGDGIPNLAKYAFGLDPLKPNKDGLPTFTLKNGQMILSFTKPKSVTGLRYILQAVTDLGTPASEEVTLSKVGETASTETWQGTVAANGAHKFALSSLAEVGVTARQVQELLLKNLNTVSTNQTLWTIQPGLGTVMIEYGRRIALMKLAADAGAWDMAQYQLTEATEIQEVGETTRPAKAALLKDFESNHLDPLAKDILAKDSANFTAHFNDAVQACNGCHAGTGHAYVTFQTPTKSPESFLNLVAGNPKAPTTNAPPAPITPAGDTALNWAEVYQQIDSVLNTVDTRLGLWNIQPGLGTVMMEYGRRFAIAKLAADAGDWGMAQYQLTEATEIQEVGETTRPAKAALLKDFESNYLDPLAKDILAKDSVSFGTHYQQAIEGCNACHVGTGHGYVNVKSPTESPQPFLKLASSNPTAPSTNSTPLVATPPSFPARAPGLADAQKIIDDSLNTVDLNLALWNIQPGLGTVMMEYGYRFALVWLAAEAGNWGMAQYQLTEATEIQEVGETTRPAKAPLLKDFESNYLAPVQAAITAKDKTSFETAYSTAVEGCNACHVGTKHPYVRYQTPTGTLADFLKLSQ